MTETEIKESPPPRRLPLRKMALPLVASVGLVIFASWVIAFQVEQRNDFAGSTVARDVEQRWGAPVVQPAPTLRYVQSGSIFTELKALPFDKQAVQVDARMNYRKRGLRYFSGFDFALTAAYEVVNSERADIDVAFIFPIEVNKSQVLLSELQFRVDDKEARLDLGKQGNRLVWTGRIAKGATARFAIRYKARGLDSFVYKLDPSLPARNVAVHVGVQGGDGFDYPAGVLSADKVVQTRDAVALDWAFPSLESGVNLGVVLPSEKTFDSLIATMARRAWVPFLAFALVVMLLAARQGLRLLAYEQWLVAAAFGFTFVLLAYLAAFLNFYLAYAIAIQVMGAVVVAYVQRLLPGEKAPLLWGLWGATMIVPTGAVILEGYTGLIYTAEILAALIGLMALSLRKEVRAFLTTRIFAGVQP
jgi:hypothetical protein